MRGTVLDLETVADGAQRLLADAGLTERATFITGDFFGPIPRGGDLCSFGRGHLADAPVGTRAKRI